MMWSPLEKTAAPEKKVECCYVIPSNVHKSFFSFFSPTTRYRKRPGKAGRVDEGSSKEKTKMQITEN